MEDQLPGRPAAERAPNSQKARASSSVIAKPPIRWHSPHSNRRNWIRIPATVLGRIRKAGCVPQHLEAK